MALLPANVFQPPTTSLTLLIPPASYLQWVQRFFQLIFTIATIPIIIILVPISIILPQRFAPLSLHPHNSPPYRTFFAACQRGWMVYCLGGLIWAITGSGSAPDNQDDVSPTMTWLACKLVEGIAWVTGSKGNGGKLQVSQVDIPSFSRDLCVGVLDLDDLDRRSIVGFQLDSPRAGLEANSKPKPHKAILWLSGGGYVTGYPLVDPPIFSIARNLPRGEYTLLAPSVRRCLSLDRAFPIPLLDALAGYEYLRRVGGYEAKDIVIMGNSAGSGLSWSMVAYLAILQDASRGHLGIPGSVIMISPWMSLPPVPPPKYPDLVDEPQLLNAARCYLARFPLVPSRPDPFSSDWYLWDKAIRIRLAAFRARLKAMLGLEPLKPTRHTTEKIEKQILGTSRTLRKLPKTHIGWLDESTFTQLSSHHPLLSPSTDIGSSFVKHTLEILAHHGIVMFIHCGTAEWFYEPGIAFAREAEKRGVKVVLHQDKGGFHVEGCVMPPDLGGAAARLQDKVLDFLTAER